MVNNDFGSIEASSVEYMGFSAQYLLENNSITLIQSNSFVRFLKTIIVLLGSSSVIQL